MLEWCCAQCMNSSGAHTQILHAHDATAVCMTALYYMCTETGPSVRVVICGQCMISSGAHTCPKSRQFPLSREGQLQSPSPLREIVGDSGAVGRGRLGSEIAGWRVLVLATCRMH